MQIICIRECALRALSDATRVSVYNFVVYRRHEFRGVLSSARVDGIERYYCFVIGEKSSRDRYRIVGNCRGAVIVKDSVLVGNFFGGTKEFLGEFLNNYFLG